jgi:hypothetical protein
VQSAAICFCHEALELFNKLHTPKKGSRLATIIQNAECFHVFLSLFTWRLFNDIVNSSDKIQSNDRVINEQ